MSGLLNEYLNVKKKVERQQVRERAAAAPIEQAEIRENDNARNARVAALKMEFGEGVDALIAQARENLKSMAPAERARYEKADDDGIHRLNKPGVIKELARGGIDKSLPRDDASINSEIASIEDAMRRDRKSYNKNEALQQRYRALLAKKHGD